ncbi:hypothetical protein D1007_07772 [Hordeum vulgare]|nr:hypothetical protein D1007_07772 [Hordeum vulgare]
MGSICRGNVSTPLVPNDVGYLDFFTKVVERLEADARQVGALIEEEIHDFLSRALTCVFSNLLCVDPRFDFEATRPPVPEAICSALGEVVGDHVDTLRAQFAPDNLES